MNDATSSSRPRLSLIDAVCVAVGIVIGSGIFKSTPEVASRVDGVATLFAVWLVGGGLALVGALCYAELAALHPGAGGEYLYLRSAFGRRLAFVFAWLAFWLVRPGNIGAMAFVFAEYALDLAPPAWRVAGGWPFACGAIAVFTALNLAGWRTGQRAQNFLTAIKVTGLALVIGIGLGAGWLSKDAPGASAAAPDAPNTAALAAALPGETSRPTAASTPGAWRWLADARLALVLAMFAYGGWNDLSYVAADVRNPRVNVTRALVLAVLAVAVLYVLVNAAAVRTLGFDGLRRSPAAAAEIVDRAWPGLGGRCVSVMICLSALAAINGMLITGASFYARLANEHPAFGWLRARPPLPSDAPRGQAIFGGNAATFRVVTAQGVVAAALAAGFGWRADGFERLVVFTGPVFWFFLALSGVVCLMARVRGAGPPGAFQAPLFPLTHALFCLSCLFLAHACADYALRQQLREGVYWEGAWLALVLASGLALCVRNPGAAAEAATSAQPRE